MIKSMAGKVVWVGRATVFLVGLAVILALVVGVATSALGANGQSFLLGKGNLATAITKLTGNVNGSAMQVTNSNAGADDTALSLSVQVGEAPMKVNSTTRVANLNAASAGRADSAASADTAANAQNAADADKLDGLDSANLMPGGTWPAGATIRGKYEIDGTATAAEELFDGDSISFGYTLSSTPETRLVPFEGTAPSECPGDSSFPLADPGFLCVYEAQNSNLSTTETYPIIYDPTRFGANIYAHAAAAGVAYSYGSWAVTAPTAAQTQALAQQDSSDVSQGRQEP
jgi:hypothetical protein